MAPPKESGDGWEWLDYDKRTGVIPTLKGMVNIMGKARVRGMVNIMGKAELDLPNPLVFSRLETKPGMGSWLLIFYGVFS